MALDGRPVEACGFEHRQELLGEIEVLVEDALLNGDNAGIAPERRSHPQRPALQEWVEVDVPASQSDSFASWILSFGPDARVYSPKPIRDHVVARLEALAAGG